MKKGKIKWEDLIKKLKSIVLKLEERKEVKMRRIGDKEIAILSKIYKKCKKKEKGKILDFLERYIMYNRSYIGWKLRQARDGVNSSIKMKKGRVRRKKYGEEIKRVLIKLWQISDYLYGKRLAPFLPFLINLIFSVLKK